MIQVNLSVKQKQTHRQRTNRLVVDKGKEGCRGEYWELGISRCKLLYIEWINNKVLLYSTLNCIQCTVIKHNGKDYEKEYIYIYLYIHI